MSPCWRFTALGVMLVLAACQNLPPPPPVEQEPVRADARQLHQQGQLGAALAAATSDPQFPPELRERWQQEAQSLEKDALAAAARAWKQPDWPTALALLDSALLALPDSAPLTRQRYSYQTLIDRRLLALRAERNRTEARYLLETARLDGAVATVFAPAAAPAAAQSALRNRRQALSRQLLEDAGHLQARRQWAMARESLNLVKQLAEHPEALAQAEKRLQVEEQAARNLVREDESEAAILAERKRQLLDAVQAARSAGRLADAQAAIAALKTLFPQEAEAEALRLAPLLRERARQLQREGEAAYQRGEIAKALTAWQEARTLMPDDAALPLLIRRAQTVLANLQRSQQAKP